MASSRGSLFLGKRCRYMGRVIGGMRAGRGTLFVDEGDGRESILSTMWREDLPLGQGAIVEPDGSRVVGV